MLIGIQSDKYIKENCWEKTAPVDFRKRIGKPISMPASKNFRRDFTFYQPPPSSLMNLATNIVSITPKQNKPANANLVEQVVDGLVRNEEPVPPPAPAPPPQPPQGDDAPDLYGFAPAHPVEPPPIYPVNRGRPVNPLYAFPAGGYPAPPDTYREGALEAPASQQAQRLAEAIQRGRPGQFALPQGEGEPDLYGSAPARPVERPPIYPVNRGRPMNALYAFPAGGYPAPEERANLVQTLALESGFVRPTGQTLRLAQAIRRGRPHILAIDAYNPIIKEAPIVKEEPQFEMRYNPAYERGRPTGDREEMARRRTDKQRAMAPYLPETGYGIYTTSRGGMRGGIKNIPDYPDA